MLTSAAWLADAFARSCGAYDAVVALAARDPVGAWDQLADGSSVSDAQVAEMLGVHDCRFRRRVSMLASPTINLPSDAVRLPPIRQLLWAVAGVARPRASGDAGGQS
jgi:hypothetical protein